MSSISVDAEEKDNDCFISFFKLQVRGGFSRTSLRNYGSRWNVPKSPGWDKRPSNYGNARISEPDLFNDGYRALVFYVSKLNPSCSAFFPHYPDKKPVSLDGDVWYEARPLGVNHQQNSRSFQGIRKIQREGDSDYFVIKCRSSQSAYYGYFWAPRRTKPCALQHDAFNSLQLNSKRDVQQTKVIHQVQSSPTSVTYGYKLNICLLHCFELSYWECAS